MKRKAVFPTTGDGVCLALLAGPTKQAVLRRPRRISLREAVQLALKHNHNVRIAGYASR